MDLRKAINNLLLENHKHEYGCAMLYFDFPDVFKIQDSIDHQHLYEDPEDNSFGLESEPHCTLLFGFHEEVTTEDIKRITDKYDFDRIFIAHNISKFDTNPDYDVLKFDVGYKTKGDPVLRKVNKQLKGFPHTNNFPDYHPHLTIAYVKKGMGDKYIDKFNKNQFDLKPTYVIYSKPDGTQDRIEI